MKKQVLYVCSIKSNDKWINMIFIYIYSIQWALIMVVTEKQVLFLFTLTGMLCILL